MIPHVRASRWRWSTWVWSVAGLAAAYALLAAPRGELRVQVVAVPAPIVNVAAPSVTVAPPQVTVNVPSPPTPPTPSEPAPPRAATPMVNAACVLSSEAPSCRWDDGFPAISADGRRIAFAINPDQHDSGSPGLSILFYDVRAQRYTTEQRVLAPGAYHEDGPSERVRAKATRAAARAQRVLDDGGFRALARLGRSDDLAEVPPAQLHAEFDGELVRAVDPATNRVLWQRVFVPPPSPPADPDDDCGGQTLVASEAWWDAATRAVLVTQGYHTGGCMCPDLEHTYVWRAPR